MFKKTQNYYRNKRKIYIMALSCICCFTVGLFSFKFFSTSNVIPNTQPSNITQDEKNNTDNIVSISNEELIRIRKILNKDEDLDTRAYAYAEAMVKQDIEKGIIPKGTLTMEELEKSKLSFDEHLKLQKQEEERFYYYVSEYTKAELEKRAKMKKEVK